MRSRRDPSRLRGGFTLVELLVAVAASGLVLLAARQVLGGLEDDVRRLERHVAEADATANGERALRALVGRLDLSEAGTDPMRGFGGDSIAVAFSSWCERPAGWLERCAVTLRLVSDSGQVGLQAQLSTGETLVLWRANSEAAVRYLDSPAQGGRWLHVWGRGTRAPLALGLVTARDTTILRIGARE